MKHKQYHPLYLNKTSQEKKLNLPE